MSTSTLNVRIKHKFDTWENWKNSSIILEKGELAIVNIPAKETEGGLTPPAIGIKVGDGSSTFMQLDWIQAIAGDVPAWAKSDSPTVTEIGETFKASLAEYIHSEVENDTNTTYTFDYANNKLVITTYNKTQEGNVQVGEPQELEINLDTKIDKVVGVEGNVVEFGANGAVVDGGKKLSDYLTIASAESTYAPVSLEGTVSEINTRLGTAEGEIDNLQQSVETLLGGESGSVKDIVDAAINKFATDVTNNDVVDSFKELVDWVAEHGPEAAEMASNIEANTTAIESLSEDRHNHKLSTGESNLDVLNQITQEKVNAWDASGSNSKDYVDGLIKEVNDDIKEINDILGDGTTGGLRFDMTQAQSDIENLNSVSVQTISGVTTTKSANNIEITAIPLSLLGDGTTIIFDCGSASTVL